MNSKTDNLKFDVGAFAADLTPEEIQGFQAHWRSLTERAARNQVQVEAVNTESQIRQALVNMGWTPPGPAPYEPWNTDLPPDGVFVLVKCPSGYTTAPWVYTTARICSDYHAGRWITASNDDLSDGGLYPIGWRHIPQGWSQ
jgi:hypothetical protein